MLRFPAQGAHKGDDSTAPLGTASVENADQDSLFGDATSTKKSDESTEPEESTAAPGAAPVANATTKPVFKDITWTKRSDEAIDTSPRRASIPISPKSQPRPSSSGNTQSRSPDTAAEITSLRKELEEILRQLMDIGTTATKRRLRAEKEDLISRISRLERAEGKKKIGVIKAVYDQPMQELPEPIGRREKQDLLKGVRTMEKTRFSSPKRPRQRRDESDEELDGEERFQLGIKKKRKKMPDNDNNQTTIDDKEKAKENAKLAAEKERERQERLSSRREKRKIVSKKK